jgi:hypothetical protein
MAVKRFEARVRAAASQGCVLDQRKRNAIHPRAHLDVRRHSNNTVAGLVSASASPRAPQRRPIRQFAAGRRMAGG